MKYKTKAEWAAANAERLRNEASEERSRRVPGADWRGVRSKMAIVDNLSREASRYEAMSERFRARGI